MSRSTIDKRPNGRYRARYVGPDNKWHSKTFDRRVDADRWRRAQLSSIDTASWVDPRAGSTPFSAVAAAWEAGRLGKRPSTRARDHSLLNSLVVPHLGSMPVAHITPSTLEQWIASLQDDGKAPATIRKAWQIASAVLRMAVKDRLIASTPAVEVELPAHHQNEPRFLTGAEVMDLVDAMDERWRAMVLVGAFAGLRFGEVAGLQCGYLDLLRRRLTVRRTVTDVRGRPVVGPPKTARGVRSVTLPAVVVEALEAHLSTLEDAGPEGWLVTAPGGGPLSRRNFARRYWRPAVRASVGEPLRFHDLRHTHAAILIAQGEHPRAIADRLGHASVRVVLDVYGHLMPGTDERVADRLDEQIASYSRPERVQGSVTDLPDRTKNSL